MKVLVDVGNTNICVGIKELNKYYRLRTDKQKLVLEYSVLFDKILNEIKVTKVIVSSVVPELNQVIDEYFMNYHHIKPLFISPGIKTGIKIKADNSKEVGADLIACAVGASTKYGDTALIVDMGTATTITYLKNNTIEGVTICPGLNTSKKSLISDTSLLPDVSIEAPSRVLGNNSSDCIKSGLVYGHASMIDGLIRRIKKETNEIDINVIITGGLAKLVSSVMETEVILDDELIFVGLNTVLDRN